ncbi:MAG: ArnT family glycosyltransferase, partial [Candidatus Aminicenantales bacterium]
MTGWKRLLRGRSFRDLTFVGLVFFLAIAVRAVFLVHYRMIGTDSTYYAHIARLFAEGHWQRALDPYWPPFYPFLVSGVSRLGVSLEASGLFVSLLASAATVILCFFLGKLIAGRSVGCIAACLAVFHPRLIVISQSYLTEPLYMFLSCGALVLFCYSSEAVEGREKMGTSGRAAISLGTGILLGFAFLTRIEGVFYFLFLLAWSTGYHLWRPPPGKTTTSQAMTKNSLRPWLILLGFALVSSFYTQHVTRMAGRFTLSEKAEGNFYLAFRSDYQRARIPVEFSNYDSITEPEVPRRYGDYHVFAFIRRHPDKIIKRIFKNLPRAVLDKIPSLMYWPLFLLSVFGLSFRRKVPRSRYDRLFAFWILLTVLVYSPLFLFRRFFVGTLPVLIVWCAVGVEELRQVLPRAIRRAGAALGIALMLLIGHISLSSSSRPVLYREAGLWLKEHAEEPIILSGRKPETSFYAEAEFRPLKAQSKDDLYDFMKEEAITHLVVEDYILPRSNPELADLIDPKNAPPWLKAVYSSDKNGHK